MKILSPKSLVLSSLAFCSAAMPAAASTIIVDPFFDFTVRRNNSGNIGTIESNIHPKQSTGAGTDRFAMLRFDSGAFGPGVTGVESQISAGTFGGATYTFSLHGVNDGDPQDELVVEGSYNPDASTANLFRDTDALIDFGQVTTFGTIDAKAGDVVSFSDPNLLSFIQDDANGVATLVITRNTNSADNSAFGALKLILQVVTEPSSVLLCALGGLFLMRRKR